MISVKRQDGRETVLSLIGIIVCKEDDEYDMHICKQWLQALQQNPLGAITTVIADPVQQVCRHMAPLGHNGLNDRNQSVVFRVIYSLVPRAWCHSRGNHRSTTGLRTPALISDDKTVWLAVLHDSMNRHLYSYASFLFLALVWIFLARHGPRLIYLLSISLSHPTLTVFGPFSSPSPPPPPFCQHFSTFQENPWS